MKVQIERITIQGQARQDPISTNKWDMMAHACSYVGGINKRMAVQASMGETKKV
jgi:hypothetical protein